MTKTRNLADLGGGFIQAGTGAVQRTVESKLQDVVSVLDFGANPNGLVDCAPAINAAIVAAATGYGRSSVVFPAGTYYIESPIILKQNVSLQGLVQQNAPNATRYGVTITTDQPINMISQTENLPGDQQSGIYDLFLDGQNVANRGVYFQYARGSRFERVVVMRCREYGFYMDNPNDNLDSFAWDFNQCYVNMPNGQYPGAPIYAAYHVRGPFAHFFNCKSDGGQVAYEIEGTSGSSSAGYTIIQNCHSEGFKVAGVNALGAAGNIKVLGCTFISATSEAIGNGQSYIKLTPLTQTGGFIVSNNTLRHFGVPGNTTIGVDVSANAPGSVVLGNSIENMYYGIKNAGTFSSFSNNLVSATETAYYTTAPGSFTGGYASCGASGFIVDNQSAGFLKDVSFIQSTTPDKYRLARPHNYPSTFRAIGSTVQTLANVVWTKVLLDGSETWDQFGEFASSTFTATVPGYYQFNASIEYNATVPTSIALYKNGIVYNNTPLASGSGQGIGSIIKLAVNETVELYMLTAGTPDTVPAKCYLDGYLLSTI